MLPQNSQPSARRGGTTLAWSHLCASWVLPSQWHKPGSMRWCGDDKEAEDCLPVHWCKRTYTLFLRRRISARKYCACWRCVKQPLHWAMLDLLFLGAWKLKSHKTAAANPHVVGHLYMQPAMCCVEKPLSVCSASQEQTHAQGLQRPVVCSSADHTGASQAGGQQDLALPRGLPASCTLSFLWLKKTMCLDEDKEQNHSFNRNWCLFPICLPAHFV